MVIKKPTRTAEKSGYPETKYEFVGFLKEKKYTALGEPTPPMVFAPADQFPDVRPWAVLFIRFSSPPSVAITAVKEKIGQISPAIKTEFHVFQTDIENALNRERLMAPLS